MSALAPAAPATLVGPVCSRCSFGWGRDRVQVRHESIAAIYSCGGPAPAFAPVAAVVEVPVAPAPAPVPAAAPAAGEVWVLDGVLFQVRKARHSDRLFAHELVNVPSREVRPEWAYRGVASRVLAGARVASRAEIAAFGHRSSRCVFCGKQLDDERSVFAGYGETCAGHRGLPWGERPPVRVLAEG